ncbi:MAG: sensor histidine kinase [Bacteroidota bacterium]|nr:sensor histidine kinase [Bacteroidota bacterium]MDX5430632.1 sensor histidine kinase [Bacteroidota bacterium]MDX5469382.1 sensor histidine kinase [Bacteroidota bacterium]
MEREYGNRLHFETHIEPDLFIEAEETSLRLSLSNLVSNACKYGGEGSTVSLSLKQMDDDILLQVSDEGPGVPDAYKKSIFKKFYRSGDALTQVHRGTGLGLYVVSETVKRLKGKIWVEDRMGGGSTFNLLIKSL